VTRSDVTRHSDRFALFAADVHAQIDGVTSVVGELAREQRRRNAREAALETQLEAPLAVTS
jgi:hypothetical protein